MHSFISRYLKNIQNQTVQQQFHTVNHTDPFSPLFLLLDPQSQFKYSHFQSSFIIYNHMNNSDKVSGEEIEKNSSCNHNAVDQPVKYLVQFTAAQALLISQMLPKNYSLQIEKAEKSKRSNSKKKINFSRKSTLQASLELGERSQRTKKLNNNYRESEEILALNNYSRASSQVYPEEIQDTMKPCLRILQLLKSHKTSWAFREPVDPIALGIPNYFDIIKEPMDLQTIQKNLRNKAYLTQTQFHVDVKKIIKNSFEFNKFNPDFTKLTSQFERYYSKITNETNNRGLSDSNNHHLNSKKKSKPSRKGEYSLNDYSESQPPTLVQKKLLANQIKKLPRQYLAEVAEIVYQGRPPVNEQVNIQMLPAPLIRQLQRLVKDKMVYIEMVTNNQRREEQVPNQEDQSSFESDSDS